MGFIGRLVSLRGSVVGRELLYLYGVEIPSTVKIGKNFQLLHRGIGTVIHPQTVIGDDVRIYHQVTIGRADAHLPREDSPMVSIEIGDGAVLFPGAKVLGGPGVTRIGRGTIIAANAVVTQSTGDYETWAGIPARRVR